MVKVKYPPLAERKEGVEKPFSGFEWLKSRIKVLIREDIMLHVTSGLHAYRWSAYKVSNGCFKSIKNGMHNGVGHFGSEHIGNLFRCSPPFSYT